MHHFRFHSVFAGIDHSCSWCVWCQHGEQYYIRNSQGLPYVPATTYGRAAIGKVGVANKLFLAFLFAEKEAGIQLLKDVGLLRSSVLCSVCCCRMCCVDASVKDAFRWRCRRKTSAFRCNVSTSIRHDSWFTQSNLSFMEVLFLTYDIVCRVPAQCIQLDHHFSEETISDWTQFCRETMLDYVQGCSQKICGPNKTVEIDESKFGRRKYNRQHAVKGQWVFGGVERESGRTFLVPVPDRTADTLIAVISD